jgi:hypothetical protein
MAGVAEESRTELEKETEGREAANSVIGAEGLPLEVEVEATSPEASRGWAPWTKQRGWITVMGYIERELLF